MNTRSYVQIGTLIISLLIALPGRAQPFRPHFAAGEILIKLTDNAYVPTLRSAAVQLGGRAKPLYAGQPNLPEQLRRLRAGHAGTISRLARLRSSRSIAGVRHVLRTVVLRSNSALNSAAEDAQRRTYIVYFPRSADVEQLVELFRGVAWVELATLNSTIEPSAYPSTLPNDTFIDPQQNGTWAAGTELSPGEAAWAQRRVKAHEAWSTSTGRDVVVAVLDTACDPELPDLRDKIAVNTREIPNNGKDDDKNGLVDDYLGYDFMNDAVARAAGRFSSSSSEYGQISVWQSADKGYEFHGTAVAALIAGRANNAFGAAGVAPDAKILPVRVINELGYADQSKLNAAGTFAALARAIRYAADRGARVINMSLALKKVDQAGITLLQDAVNYVTAKGVVVVAAAGNAGVSEAVYPAALNNVIAVAATDYSDRRASFSNFGSYVDIAAPGVRVLVSVPATVIAYNSPDIYTTLTDRESQLRIHPPMNGTSFSSPLVAGAAALVLAVNPQLTPEQVRKLLTATASSLVDSGVGAGLLNAAAAVKAAAPPRAAVKVCTNPRNQYDVDNNGAVTSLDVLAVRNWINSESARANAAAKGYCVDVNKDGSATSNDVLMITNYLNRK